MVERTGSILQENEELDVSVLTSRHLSFLIDACYRLLKHLISFCLPRPAETNEQQKSCIHFGCDIFHQGSYCGYSVSMV
jgi:hypothetical protein